MKTKKELEKEIEDKWFKECKRLSDEIERLQKIVNLKSIKKHPDFIKLKNEINLTNKAYNDVCTERDNLKEVGCFCKGDEELREICKECKRKTRLIGFKEHSSGSYYFIVYYCNPCNHLFFKVCDNFTHLETQKMRKGQK